MFDLVFVLARDKHHQVATNQIGFFETVVGRDECHDGENLFTEKFRQWNALVPYGINNEYGFIIHETFLKLKPLGVVGEPPVATSNSMNEQQQVISA
jgi:hypothetical protein